MDKYMLDVRAFHFELYDLCHKLSANIVAETAELKNNVWTWQKISFALRHYNTEDGCCHRSLYLTSLASHITTHTHIPNVTFSQYKLFVSDSSKLVLKHNLCMSEFDNDTL